MNAESMKLENLARVLYMTYQGARMGNMDNWSELSEEEKSLWLKQAEQLGRIYFIGDMRIHAK